MAEAARTTRHYVSDSLAERYPYDAKKAFAGARQRDTGAVFSGYDALGTTNLMNSLTDPVVDSEGKAKAAHHLYSRSASQETKIEMLQYGIVPLLVATLNGASDMLLIHQCLLLLRSLAVIPQGCYALVFQGAMPPTVKALHTAAPTGAASATQDEAANCRVAAAHVIYQVSSNMSGMRWLLGLPHETAVAGLKADYSVAPLQPEELMREVVDVLAEDQGRDSGATTMAGHLLHALAHLTSLPRGVAALLSSATAIRTISAYLTELVSSSAFASSSMRSEVALGEAALEVMWNVGLDRAGEVALEAAAVPPLLFDVFAGVCGDASAPAVSLQRQLTGALSAVYQLTSVKMASTSPMLPAEKGGDKTGTRLDALLQYLRHWNDVIDTEYARRGRAAPNGVAAIVKNTVQCIRLASEVRAVRDATHAFINERERVDATEAFHLRHQLYFRTKWEAEYGASVEV
ncbi:hypothetical protein ABB37_04868 [Leptomonas pyrrhocoris]|uniref:Uncharacterized protein n=1 Tax=Leptomonas pyrrhocoris TaxID=157538 RepID=A0A0N0VFD7_LEPPY|nr:hypothetical protein ABB37_04868 [Leptomonas pyrrhocoris]XP_015659133.1 hypothetical protein ABB37_04868 [Leptomonas pyrrhocoris]KPA80693.1 hypothetical protein ABB37_04868 [Leptomonas pyrrhocoris]KPA80694.1 hypothetical protein ABB37_04868 [Leptomonas pyrrhocoris]|eukprot:XP_015659132.1 hypothetical protein ABB37_04868 [Leptomonas pyrrhocoris]